MTAIVLGVDIGREGAIAVFTEAGELVEVHDMPCLSGGPAKRRSVNAPLLAEIIAKSHAASAFVEHVAARPKESPAGAFAFGRSRHAGPFPGVAQRRDTIAHGFDRRSPARPISAASALPSSLTRANSAALPGTRATKRPRGSRGREGKQWN
jgi:hypothetical protein